MERKILIIAPFISLPDEKGNSRFTYLAQLFSNCSYNVVLLTSQFSHITKRQRDIEKYDLMNLSYELHFLKSSSYSRNISIRRIISHIKLSYLVNKYLEKYGLEFSAIYCALPIPEVAAVAAKFAKNNAIPFILDIQDIWPEAFKMVIPNMYLLNIIFFKMIRCNKIAFQYANAIIGVSETYAKLAKYGVTDNRPMLSVFLGTDINDFNQQVIKYENKIVKDSNEIWLGYAGTFGKSYDIKTMILGTEKVIKDGYNIRIILLGDGPDKEKILDLLKKKSIKYVYPGYVEYGLMGAYLKKCNILVNCINRHSVSTVINKIADYLAAGIPILNGSPSEELNKLVSDYYIGKNYIPENIDSFYTTLLDMISNVDQIDIMKSNSFKVANSRFDRATSYQSIIHIVDSLVK